MERVRRLIAKLRQGPGLFVVYFVALAIAIVGVVLVIHPKPPNVLPAKIAAEASFATFYPMKDLSAANPPVDPEYSSINYNTSGNELAYTVLVDNKQVAVTEQAEPDIFSQDGVYDFKLQQANEYNSFSTSAGDVTLTKPTELNGQTVAWLVDNNTLVLAHALNNLTENEWKLLFNNMQNVN